MLSGSEFTVGAVGDGSPVSLMLPRSEQDQTMLIGHGRDGPEAVFLSGDYSYLCFPSAGATAWQGLIVPNVRVEVDETSLFDSGYGQPPGAIVRADTRLFLVAQRDRGRSATEVGLLSNLPPTHNARAVFPRWHVVIGEGMNKRVLAKIDVGQK